MLQTSSAVYVKVVYNCVFLRKYVRQNAIDVTSLCVQFEKVGRVLMWDLVNTEAIQINLNSFCVQRFF